MQSKVHNIFIIYEKKEFVKKKMIFIEKFIKKLFEKILNFFQKGIDISEHMVYND